MATIGAAELDVVPSVKNFKGRLDKDLAPQLKSSGLRAGERLGAGMVGGVKKHLVGIGASIGAAFAVKRVITSSVNSFKDWTLGVIQMKRVAGGSVAGVSRLRFAIQESGVDTTKATNALGIFSKKLATANGDTKKTAALTKQLGFAYLNAGGHIKPLTVLLPQLADKFKGMPDGPAKAALAMQLFGKSGRDLLPFLNKGSAGIAELRDKSDQLGLTLNQHSIDKFSAYKAATREWSASLQGLRVSLGGALLPSLTRFNQFLTRNLGPGIQKLRLFVKTSPDVKRASRAVGLGLADVAKWSRKDVVPAIAAFVQGMQDGTGAGGAFAGSLRGLVGVGRGVVGLFQAMPAPVSKTLLKIGLAAIAVNRLQKAITAVRTSAFVSQMTAATTATEVQGAASTATAGRMAFLGGAMKAAAGVGGMLLLTDATNRSSKSMGLLQGAAGGAALGFAVGGPWGAAIGGAAGGLLGVFGAGHKAAKGIDVAAAAAAAAQQQTSDLAGSLNEVTAAYTKMTFKMVSDDLRKSGAFAAADQLGLRYTTLTRAALGYPGAIARVNAALIKAKGPVVALATAIQNDPLNPHGKLTASQAKLAAAANVVTSSVKTVTSSTAAARRQILLTAIGAQEYAKSLKRVPERMILKIGTEGKKQALTDIGNLKKQVDLTPKQIKLLLSIANLPAITSNLNAVNAAADHATRSRVINISVGPGGLAALHESRKDPTIKGRANGGRVTAGVPYIVGERRAELYIPDQSGRIEPRVNVKRAAASSTGSSVASEPISMHGRRMVLHIAGRQIEGVIEEIADGRIDSADQLRGETDRAFG